MEPPDEMRILCGPDEDPAVSPGGLILGRAQLRSRRSCTLWTEIPRRMHGLLGPNIPPKEATAKIGALDWKTSAGHT